MRKTKHHGLNVDNPAGLGQRIAGLRERQGFTQGEIAEKLKISQSLMSQYENGLLRPNAALLIQLSKILKISSDEILGLKALKNSEEKTNRKVLKRLKQIETLPRRKQETLLNTIDMFLKGAVS